MKKSFVMFAAQRSGTTALRDGLNSCPDIEMYGETYFPSFFDWGYYSYFAREVARQPETALPRGRGASYGAHFDTLKAAHPALHVGMDVKYDAVALNPGLIPELGKAADVAIHLRRRNVLRSLVSHRVMEARVRRDEEIHSTKVMPPLQIRLPLKGLVPSLRRRRQQMRRFGRELERGFGRVVELDYEGLFEAGDEVSLLNDGAARAICDALDCSWQGRFVCKLRKQTSQALEEVLTNYDEVADHLSGTDFAGMLTSP